MNTYGNHVREKACANTFFIKRDAVVQRVSEELALLAMDNSGNLIFNWSNLASGGDIARQAHNHPYIPFPLSSMIQSF